jgi:YVTN family beta-propeller protein
LGNSAPVIRLPGEAGRLKTAGPDASNRREENIVGKTCRVGWMALLLLLIAGELPAARIAPFLTAPSRQIAAPSSVQTAGTGASALIPEIQNRKLDPGLRALIGQRAALRKGGPRAPQTEAQDRINVMLQTREGGEPDRAGILSRNGRILSERRNVIAAALPLERIEEIVDSDPQIEFARLPHPFRPLGVVSQGVGLTSAPNYHEYGYRGQGVKIAVIDLGFKGLTSAQASGDLPQSLFTRDFTGKGLETRYKHGTACAEIVHDMAPEAELHLLKIADEADFQAAFDYCLANRIKIVSLSLGAFGTGPGNGTGPIHDLCNQAREQGILIVASAGNAANTKSSDGVPVGTHWEGLFTDVNDDAVHEFSGQSGNVIIAMPKWDDDGNPEQDEVAIGLRWDDWQAVTIDYDMHLYHYDYQAKTVGGLAASSAALQNGAAGQRPYEGIQIDVPDGQPYQFFYLQVTRKAGSPAGAKLEVFLGGNGYFIGPTAYGQPIATSSGSILEPADGQSVFAVGAVNHADWPTGPQEDFSSQGPTNDWAGAPARIKPDIGGPDRVRTHAYGESFPGTSAAAPHVAGAAALLWSLRPALLPGEVQSSLESWARDLGEFGKDNLSGWGALQLGSYALSINQYGSGSVSLMPGAKTCDSYCSLHYPAGMEVTMTAVPDDGYAFDGWNGVAGCSGTGPCTLTMDSAKDVTVGFREIYRRLSVSMAGTGIGRVTFSPSGSWCYWNSCANFYRMGSTITLAGEPYFDSAFAGWSGAGCSGRGTCTVTVTADATVTATFLTPVPVAFVPNFAADTVSIINTVHDLLIATVPVGDGPRSVAVSPDGTGVYVGNSGSDSVSVIDTLSKTVAATIPVGSAPMGVAVDPAGMRVYVANHGSDSLSVIDRASHAVIETIPVGNGPMGVAVDPSGARVYVANNGSNSLSVVDTAVNAVIAAIPVGNAPVGVAVHPAGTRVYVTNHGSNTLSVIDRAVNTVVATVAVGSAPYGVAIDPAGSRVYVTNQDSHSVSVIDASSETLLAAIPVGNAPNGISCHPAGTRIYVTNYGSSNVSVIDAATNTVLFPSPNAWNGPFAFGQFISAVALKGDVNDDWSVNLADAILALQVVSGTHPSSVRSDYRTSGADLSGNRKIGLEEVIYIMQTLALLR